MAKYVKVVCNCEEVITIAETDVAHIDEMIETIRYWEEISQEQAAKIRQLEYDNVLLRHELRMREERINAQQL